MRNFWLLIFLLLTFFIQAVYAAWNDAVTYDEPAHISAGYFYLKTRDFSIHPIDPPLMREIIALPLLFSSFNLPIAQWSSMERHLPWERGLDMLYSLGNDPTKLLFATRLPNILLALALGFLIFIWSYKLWGEVPAFLALFLYVFEPNLLAHAHLATVDFGLVFFGFLSFFFLWRYLNDRQPEGVLLMDRSVRSFYLWAFVLGITLGIKLSALFFVLTPSLSVWFYQRLWKEKVKPLKFLKEFFLLILIVSLTLWAIYAFSAETIVKDTGSLFTFANFVKNRWPVFYPVANLVSLLGQKIFFPPKFYLLGLWDLFQQNQAGLPAFLFNRWVPPNFSWFFLILILLKTQLVLLLGFAVGGFCWFFKKKGKEEKLAFLIFFTVLGFVLIFSLISKYHYGIRHLLLIYPILIMLFTGFFMRLNLSQKSARLLILGLMIIHLGSNVRIAPYYLTYFNEVAELFYPPYLIRTDADLDWGQGLKDLNRFVKENGIQRIALDYYGFGNPSFYQLPYVSVVPKGWEGNDEWLAISASNYPGWQDQLKGLKPFAVVGRSILVFRFKT